MRKLLKRLINITGEFNQTSYEVFGFIQTYGIETGSSRWGVETENSDIDVLIPPHSKLDFDDIFREHNGRYLHGTEDGKIMHYTTNDFQSLYVLHGDKIYNLLFMWNEEAFERWVYATLKMTENVRDIEGFQESIRDKEHRVKLFEEYKEEYIYDPNVLG